VIVIITIIITAHMEGENEDDINNYRPNSKNTEINLEAFRKHPRQTLQRRITEYVPSGKITLLEEDTKVNMLWVEK
jgi:hypothetical protein